MFLHDSGIKQNTIGVLQSVVRPAFEMAVDDDIIRKNPFKFKLSDVVPKDAYIRDALTKEQQEKYLQFVQDCGGNSVSYTHLDVYKRQPKSCVRAY